MITDVLPIFVAFDDFCIKYKEELDRKLIGNEGLMKKTVPNNY